MTFEIRIPTDLGDKNLINFFRGWKWLDNPDPIVEIIIHKGTHIAPWAVTLFCAYMIWLKEVRNIEVIMEYESNSYSGKFIERMGFPQLLGYEAENIIINDQRICPLKRISHSKEIAPFVTSVMQLLCIEDEEISAAVKYSLVELLRNVVQHSRSRIGGLATAVYMPKTGIVEVVVADIGCGIRTALRETYKEIDTDHKAVRFAIQPHVSGTFTSGAYQNMRDNAGLGLFFIKEIATMSGGGFFLGSGDMLVDHWGNKDGTPGKNYIQSSTGGWRGTFALLQLRRDSIGEFDALLARCREIAAEFRKDKSELLVDFLDETPELEDIIVVAIKKFEEDVEVAAEVREKTILPTLSAGKIIVLDFKGIRAATQSFIHALMYKVFREGQNLATCLSVSCADQATEQAIRAVSAYATVENTKINI